MTAKSRRNRLIFLGAFGVLGAGLLVYVVTRGPEAFTYSVAPIDDSHAVVALWSNDSDGGPRHWLQEVDTQGTVVWRHETTPWVALGRMSLDAVVADAEHVYLAGNHGGMDGTLSVVARRIDDGTVVWSTAIADPGGATMPLYAPMRVADGQVYFAFGVEGLDEVLFALDAATGAERWRTPPIRIAGRFLHEGWIISPGLADETWINAATGAIALPLDRFGTTCFTGDELLYVDHDDRRIMAVPLGAPLAEPRVVRPPLDREGDLEACGTYGDSLVLTFKRDGGLWLQGLDARSGEERWRLDLPGHRLLTGADEASHPERLPLSGTLTRYAVVDRNDGATSVALPILDLERGTVLGEVRAGAMTFMAAASDMIYVLIDTDPPTIVAIDVSAGSIAGAVHYDANFRIASSDVFGDLLWVSNHRGVADLDATAWAVLDGHHGLKALHVNGRVAVSEAQVEFVPSAP